MEIEVINWEKYNPRKDYHQHWFRLDSSFYLDPKFAHFDASHLAVWLIVLSMQCQAQGKAFYINLELISSITKLKKAQVSSILKNLEQIHIVRWSGANCESTDCTNSTNELTNNLPQLDFEALYQNYPRKSGKGAGMEACKKKITTLELYLQLEIAIKNYADHCRDREKKHIKYFSSFMKDWRDWLEVEREEKIKYIKVTDEIF